MMCRKGPRSLRSFFLAASFSETIRKSAAPAEGLGAVCGGMHLINP
jgi:hypothetical protein